MSKAESIAAIQALGAEKRLPGAHLERWVALDAASRDALLALARDLRMRTGQIVTALDLLDEIAVRERETIAEILARDAIRRIAGGGGSAPARARAVLDALRQIRFPRLADSLKQLRAEVAALKLPRGISIVLPKELGSDELTVSITARSAAELEKLIEAIEGKRAGLMRIVEMLGGRGGI